MSHVYLSITAEVQDYIKGVRVCRFDSWKDGKAEDFSRLSYGDLKPLEKHQTPEPYDFAIPELLSGSDYCSSGSVEVSNHRVFMERYGKLPNVHDVYGDYGTFAVAIRLDSLTEEMIEDLKALEDYPVLDEDDHSKVEMEAEQESWDNCYRSDFQRALAKKFPAHEDVIDEWGDSELDPLFHKLMECTNTYWKHESGNNAYVDVKRVVEGATEDDITAVLHD